MLAQLVVDSVINAALYSVLLAGYQFYSNLKHTSNFAFGGLVALAGYTFWSSLQAGWGVWPAILFALVCTGLVSFIYEYVFAFFMKKEGLRQEILIIVSVILLIATEAVIQLVYGASPKAITIFSPTNIMVLGVKITQQQVVLSVAAILLTAILVLWLYRTRSGLAFRAMRESQTNARTVALSVPRANQVAAGIALIAAGVGGIFVAAERSLNPHIGTSMVIIAFILATLSGQNARRWLPVCLLFSAFQVVITWYFGSTLADVVLYTFVFIYLVRERFMVWRWLTKLGESNA